MTSTLEGDPPGTSSESEQPSSSPEKSGTPPEAPKIFGQEVLPPDDIRAMAKEVGGWLKEDQPDSALKAARQLSHLKRARIGVSDPKSQEMMNESLLQHMDHFRSDEVSGMDRARYFGHLKYLGINKELEDTDQAQLTLDADKVRREEPDNVDKLARLQVWSKYLGAESKPITEVQKTLQESLKEQAGDPNKEVQAAKSLARLKYLGVDSKLTKEQTQKIKQGVDSQIYGHAANKNWSPYMRLHNLRASAFGPRPIKPLVKSEISNYLAEEPHSGEFASKFAEAVSFADRNKNEKSVIPAPETEPSSRAAVDEEHVLFVEPIPESVKDTGVDLGDTGKLKTPSTQPEEVESPKGINVEQTGAFGTGVISTETYPGQEKSVEPEQSKGVTVEKVGQFGETVVSTEIPTFPEAPETRPEAEPVKAEEKEPVKAEEGSEPTVIVEKGGSQESANQEEEDTPGFITAIRTLFAWLLGTGGKILTWLGKMTNPK